MKESILGFVVPVFSGTTLRVESIELHKLSDPPINWSWMRAKCAPWPDALVVDNETHALSIRQLNESDFLTEDQLNALVCAPVKVEPETTA